MRPYLAIIKDSFRAALASRVLYVLLGLIVLFLLIIAPLHVRESLDTKIFTDRDIQPKDRLILMDRIKEEIESEKPSGMNRIWEMLSQEMKDKVDQIASPAEGEKESSDVSREFAAQSLVGELNDLIEDPEFYREDDWKDVDLRAEAKSYVDKGVDTLTQKQKKRLNRILISNAFKGLINPGARSSLDFFYGPFDWSSYLSGIFVTNVSQDQFASQISGTISYFLDKVVLSIGLLIAILVTANVVPQTFEPGTLNLLLSKPMSRSALFLAKFVGGCLFISLCALLLFVGLWLWMGLGLGVWERAVLISIPLYILVFAIYYSVSAFTGLMTRSTILAIVATGLFWGLCWSVGVVYSLCSVQVKAFEITRLVNTDRGVLLTDPGLEPMEWSDSENKWVESKVPEMDDKDKVQKAVFRYVQGQTPFPKSFGPVYFESEQRTAFSRVLVEDSRTHRKQQFFITDDEGVEFKRKGSLPSGITALVGTKNSLIAVNRRGRFYRFDSSLTFDTPNTDNETWFVAAGPEERVDARDARRVAVNYESDEIAIYKDGEVTVFAPDESDEKRNYKQRTSSKVETGTRPQMTCHIAYQGNQIVLAFGNGKVILLNGETLEKVQEFLPDSRVAIQTIDGSRDGQWFSLLYRDGTVRLVDIKNNRVEKPSVRGQGGISAVQFSESELLVADRSDRLTRYELETLAPVETRSPSGTWLQKSWRYVIKPLYFAFPKPGEFYKVVAHLSSANDAQENKDVDLTFQEVRRNPWSPLTSGLAFMAVMLFISCLTFARADY